MRRGPKPKSIEERFWSHVRKTSRCWLWTASFNRDGEYGFMYTVGRKRELAHRIAYKIYHGKLSRQKKVLHTCDVRICVRREHLYTGTNRDNTRDMVRRGRARWTGAGIRKLTPIRREKLKSLAQAGWPVRALARQFKVSTSTVKYWKLKAVR